MWGRTVVKQTFVSSRNPTPHPVFGVNEKRQEMLYMQPEFKRDDVTFGRLAQKWQLLPFFKSLLPLS